MPTYQYACTECDHAFEQVQSFSDDSLTECPACHGRLRKLFNAVGVVFKGSGFYRTDSRSGSGSGASSASSDSGSGSGAGGTSDTKASGSGASTGSTGSTGSSGSTSSSSPKPAAAGTGAA